MTSSACTDCASLSLDFARPLGRSDNENNRNLCSQTGNTESAEIIRRDAILIGIDSGLSADEVLPVLLDATEDPQYA